MRLRLHRRRRLEREQREAVATTTGDDLLPDGARLSFATNGEDLITRELLMRAGRDVDIGFYVDVGAYHPWRFSNTAALYRAGWSGIAVDPNPHVATVFRSERPRDTFVEAAVSDRTATAPLYCFGPWASSNTLDPEWADLVTRTQQVDVEEVITVQTVTMADLLDEHLPANTDIDLLTVDVEGLDFVALKSNDWGRYRPIIVAVEEYEMDLAALTSSPIYRLLTQHGYRLETRAVLTNFYVLDPGSS